MASSRTVTLELTERQMDNLRDAVVEEMGRTCKILRDHLRDHLNGSPVGLGDARDWLAFLNRLADTMEQLDPPGWKKTLGPAQELKAVSS